jgi:hypothetical protein
MVPVPASALEQEMLSCCPSLFPLLCNPSNLTPFYPRTRVGRRHRKRAKAGMILFSKKFVIHLCLSLSLSLSTYQSISIFIIYLPTYLFMSICLSVYPSVCYLSMFCVIPEKCIDLKLNTHTHTHTQTL